MTCKQNCSIPLQINLSCAPTPTVKRKGESICYHWLRIEGEGKRNMDIFQNLLSVVQGDVYLDCPLQRASLESSFKHTFMYADKKFMRSRFDARMLLLLQLQLSAVTHQLPM